MNECSSDNFARFMVECGNLIHKLQIISACKSRFQDVQMHSHSLGAELDRERRERALVEKQLADVRHGSARDKENL
jgi:hypothetical protein